MMYIVSWEGCDMLNGEGIMWKWNIWLPSMMPKIVYCIYMYVLTTICHQIRSCVCMNMASKFQRYFSDHNNMILWWKSPQHLKILLAHMISLLPCWVKLRHSCPTGITDTLCTASVLCRQITLNQSNIRSDISDSQNIRAKQSKVLLQEAWNNFNITRLRYHIWPPSGPMRHIWFLECI